MYLALITTRVDHAAFLLGAAFLEASVRDFKPSRSRPVIRPRSATESWYVESVNTALERFRQVRNALVHQWTPSPESEPLVLHAFTVLCELTPARHQLFEIYHHDRRRAFVELSRQLDAVAEQVELTVKLSVDAGRSAPDDVPQSTAGQSTSVQAGLLAQAGDALSLAAAAELLGISKQALHKRIGKGTALGVMHDGKIIVPSLQLVSKDGSTEVLPGLEGVVRPFLESRAGAWSALQYLVSHDPNLEQTPLEALHAGRANEVESATRALLGLDER